MSQALSNLSFSLPLSPKNSSNYLPLLKRSNGVLSFKTTPKAMAEQSRDNLDHLQRTTTKQPLPKKTPPPPSVSPGLWDRFPTARTVQQMMETMERMIEDPFAYSSGGWQAPQQSPAAEGSAFGRGRTPWEIKEGESEYKLRFDMPGMTKEDVKVWVEEKMLVVKAEKVIDKKDGEEGEGEGEWSAKSYGRYSGRIALPENVEFEKIAAEVKDGVLYITIPKASVTAKILDINVR
ncbi:heat shock protein 21, chloroplastic-like [Euphorbia lathyris]|uniref:heat shock protein 21, chloroplastic-like n=1 Tax=Euphorbia lathyris TaxID=212925 RepID=UPI0033136F77